MGSLYDRLEELGKFSVLYFSLYASLQLWLALWATKRAKMTLWVRSVENGCQAKELIIFRKKQIAEEFYNPHINISRDKTQVSESKTSPEEL